MGSLIDVWTITDPLVTPERGSEPFGGEDGLFQFPLDQDHPCHPRRCSLRLIDLCTRPILPPSFSPWDLGGIICLPPLPGFQASSPFFRNRLTLLSTRGKRGT